jgi:hypothetical protein
MANQILTSVGYVTAPTTLIQTIEEPVMADPATFPKWYFPAGGPTEPDYGGRCFESQADLDAAEGQWFPTPQAAQEAATKAPAAPAPAPEDDEPHARRSHR